MTRLSHLLIASCFFLLIGQLGKAQNANLFLQQFDALSENPQLILSEKVNGSIPSGGHLQGVSAVGNKIFVSGSSFNQGYLGIFKRDENAVTFLGIKTLSEKPYSHAGGFQIADNWLAVGCENTKTRSGSLIALQNVETASSLAGSPTFSMERTGAKKVSTAGAVALLKRKDHFLLAVGSWDCATIDLYISNHLDPTKPDFEFTLWTTWDAATTRHKNWVDNRWISYQNIQLFEDESGIYMVGTGKNRRSEQVADVFLLDPKKSKYDMLVKVRHRLFNLPKAVSFRNGASIVRNNQEMQLWAVGRSISPKLMLAVFTIKRNTGAQ